MTRRDELGQLVPDRAEMRSIIVGGSWFHQPIGAEPSALITVPGGISTSNASKRPWSAARSGTSSDLKATRATLTAAPELIGASTCAGSSEKSINIRSPRTTTRTLSGRGGEPGEPESSISADAV